MFTILAVRSFLRYALLVLVLLLVAAFSALTAMRFAIHGRETTVPKVTGLTPAEAERAALAAGLSLHVENRFYSDIAAGYIVSQLPMAGTHVRRGWPIRVAESLGTQRRIVPNVVGSSQRAAEINLRRRGLDIGAEAAITLPGSTPDEVIAQSPTPQAEASSPNVNLLFASAAPLDYVMPEFVGKRADEALRVLAQAGLKDAKTNAVAAAEPSGTVVKQFPGAGQKVGPGISITLEVAK